MQKTNNATEDKGPHHDHTQAQKCPECDTELQRKMFRTGSVQHPGHDLLVCIRCGARQDPRQR